MGVLEIMGIMGVMRVMGVMGVMEMMGVMGVMGMMGVMGAGGKAACCVACYIGRLGSRKVIPLKNWLVKRGVCAKC